MPASHEQLDAALIAALERSSAAAVVTSRSRRNPRELVVATDSGPLEVWAYIWTLTHGGRPNLPNEFRIQMTSVTSPLAVNPTGPTVLLGYHQDLEVFAGFDLERHRTFGYSPSVQIDLDALHAAHQDGFSFHRKTNNEIAIGLRPDQMLAYISNAQLLHRLGKYPETFTLLEKASKLKTITKKELEELPSERQKIVQRVVRHARDGNFREQVLRAYANCCAVTRVQLRLVEAAHILPVPAPGSTDHVTNGIALAPTYHTAFDRGLIYLDDATYEMRLQHAKADELKELNLGMGLETFVRPLGKINLPPDRGQWPHPKFIRQANKLRKVAP